MKTGGTARGAQPQPRLPHARPHAVSPILPCRLRLPAPALALVRAPIPALCPSPTSPTEAERYDHLSATERGELFERIQKIQDLQEDVDRVLAVYPPIVAKSARGQGQEVRTRIRDLAPAPALAPPSPRPQPCPRAHPDPDLAPPSPRPPQPRPPVPPPSPVSALAQARTPTPDPRPALVWTCAPRPSQILARLDADAWRPLPVSRPAPAAGAAPSVFEGKESHPWQAVRAALDVAIGTAQPREPCACTPTKTG